MGKGLRYEETPRHGCVLSVQHPKRKDFTDLLVAHNLISSRPPPARHHELKLSENAIPKHVMNTSYLSALCGPSGAPYVDNHISIQNLMLRGPGRILVS